MESITAELLQQLGIPELTDEQWSERDRQVELARERERRQRIQEYLHRRKVALKAGGVPEGLREALGAMRGDTAAMVALLPESRVRAMQAAMDAHQVVEQRRIERDSPLVQTLSGGNGVGKTYAAVRWLAWFGGARPVYITAAKLEQSSAECAYDSQARAIRDQWQQATAIVLDELGTETPPTENRSKEWLGSFSSFMRHCIDASVPLVVTTNMRKEVFWKRYEPDGGRLQSRMAQHGRWIPILGPDLRKEPLQ